MFTLDPDRIAALETAGWRAYYERRWGRLLRLIVILSQEQFHIPFPVSLVAAFHATDATRKWAPAQHDVQAVQSAYARFYRLARRYSGLRFDPNEVARLELEYNVVHRDLSGQPDKTAFVDTMTRLHAAIFGISVQDARESAEARVLANSIVDTITAGTSTDPRRDWQHIEDALRHCYRSIQSHLPPSSESFDTGGYAFTTLWLVEAPIEPVWDAIFNSDSWPSWWPYVARVDDLQSGDARGLGAVRRYTWTTRLPYRLVFESTVTHVEAPHLLEARVRGQLVGSGRWSLTSTDTGTLVRYDWNVRTGVTWMNALAFIARPLFAWNHDAVMRAGGSGLGQLLGARVDLAPRFTDKDSVPWQPA